MKFFLAVYALGIPFHSTLLSNPLSTTLRNGQQLPSSVIESLETDLPRVNVWMSMFSSGALSGSISNNNNIITPSNIVTDDSSPPLPNVILEEPLRPSQVDILRLEELDSTPSSFVNEIEETVILPQLPSLGAWRAAVKTGGIDLPPSLDAFLSGRVDLQPAHEDQVAKLWGVIRKKAFLSGLPEEDKARVIEALRIAYVALYGTTSLQGLEVAINRARGTAEVLAELSPQIDIVIAGILHDVLAETTAVEGRRVRAELVSRFGNDVVSLVDKYSRLPRFSTGAAEYTPFQAENQVQMLVAMSEDLRVLYIRLADRVHTMRQLRSLPIDDSERMKIAQETLYVYTPLAHKLGLSRMKGELEDLAFRTLHPDMFQATKYTQIAANKAYYEAAETIDELIRTDSFLASSKASFKLTYRLKGKYQLFLKMQRKGLQSLSQVRDALGLRIVVQVPVKKDESVEEREERGNQLCYYLVERLRGMSGWSPAERGFKDYIKNRKSNGYRSLHQYIRNVALGTNVEVQVRTMEMHKEAELGEAAHWYYKDQIYRPEIANSKLYRLAWRSERQIASNSPADLFTLAKKQLSASRVFVYLHDRSTVLNLRNDATALDAAFAIHSDVGLSAVAVKVDGKRVAMNRPLKNGDVINVERAPAGVVTALPSWLYLTKSPSSHQILRKHFRDHQRDQLVSQGCVQLAATIALSAEVLSGRFSGKAVPKPSRLMSLVKGRSGHKELSSFLLMLASSSKTDSRAAIAHVLGVPAEDITVPSVPAAVSWARQQQQERWSNGSSPQILDLQYNMLRKVLADQGLPLAEQRWCELVRAPYDHSRSHWTHRNSTLGGSGASPQRKRSTVAQDSLSEAVSVLKSQRIPFTFTGRSTSLGSSAPTAAPAPAVCTWRSAIPTIYLKSSIAKAGAPFSLEAASLPAPLRRLARQNYASRAQQQERRRSLLGLAPHRDGYPFPTATPLESQSSAEDIVTVPREPSVVTVTIPLSAASLGLSEKSSATVAASERVLVSAAA